MVLKTHIVLFILFNSIFISAVKAQAPAYLTADRAYTPEVNETVSLFYDASTLATKPPSIRRPTSIPNSVNQTSINQASISAALARRAQTPHTINKVQSTFRASPLATPRTQAFGSLRTGSDTAPIGSTFHPLTPPKLTTPGLTKLDKQKAQLASHGFSNHMPTQLDHGFKSSAPLEKSHGFNCCDSPH